MLKCNSVLNNNEHRNNTCSLLLTRLNCILLLQNSLWNKSRIKPPEWPTSLIVNERSANCVNSKDFLMHGSRMHKGNKMRMLHVQKLKLRKFGGCTLEHVMNSFGVQLSICSKDTNRQ